MMTREEVHELMLKHKIVVCGQYFALANAAREKERLRCVQIIESIADQYTGPNWAYQILRAIRETDQ